LKQRQTAQEAASYRYREWQTVPRRSKKGGIILPSETQLSTLDLSNQSDSHWEVGELKSSRVGLLRQEGKDENVCEMKLESVEATTCASYYKKLRVLDLWCRLSEYSSLSSSGLLDLVRFTCTRRISPALTIPCVHADVCGVHQLEFPHWELRQ